MKLLDKIMRLFGYENIENIYIYDDFKKRPPKKDKMDFRRYYYDARKEFWVPIVIKKMRFVKHRYWLEDGYTSYLIAKENNIKYVKVMRV